MQKLAIIFFAGLLAGCASVPSSMTPAAPTTRPATVMINIDSNGGLYFGLMALDRADLQLFAREIGEDYPLVINATNFKSALAAKKDFQNAGFRNVTIAH